MNKTKDTNEGEPEAIGKRQEAKDTISPSPIALSPNPLVPCMNAKKDSLSYYFALVWMLEKYGKGGLKPI